VYIHALVRDANREKMSKTKGNVIDPIEIITKYGTDAVRFTLASQASPGTDIAFNEARTEGYRAFANKIWNAARFLFMNLDRAREAGYKVTMSGAPGLASETWVGATELPDHTPLETRWIFARLSLVSAEVARALTDYRFDEAANAIYQFFWGELCDWYLELVKLRLNFDTPPTSNPTPPHSNAVILSEGPERAAGESSGTQSKDPEGATPTQAAKELSATDRATTALTLASLTGVFESALRLLSPFMPFITEEIWHALYNQQPPAKSIALTRYPQSADFPADPVAHAAMTTLQDLITTIRGLRKDLGVPEKESTPIHLHASNRIIALADANQDMLSRMARVSTIEFAPAALSGSNARSTADFDVAVVYERHIDIPAERERLTKDLAKYEKGLAAADKQLSNEAFTSKAPAHIIEGLRKQHAETKTLYDKTRAALDSLPSA
jgi:valyl-tRNA synthetase